MIVLDDEQSDVGPGSVVFIPAGVSHYLIKKSDTENFVILTFWQRAEDNEVYNLRKKA